MVLTNSNHEVEKRDLGGSYKLAYSVSEASTQTTLSKSHLRNEITAGNLKIRRINRRVIIMHDDLLEYLNKKNEK